PECDQLVTGDPPVPACPANTAVGKVTFQVYFPSANSTLPVVDPGFPIYNLKPRPGEPARFGVAFPKEIVEVLGPIPSLILNTGIAWDDDYHEYVTIHVPELEIQGSQALIASARLVFFGDTGLNSPQGAFLTNPTTCEDPEAEGFEDFYSTVLHA